MLTNALTLSLLTTGGFIAIYLKLPNKIKNFIKKHSLVTDIATLGMAYILLGGTLTALIAASMSGLLVSMLLFLSKRQEKLRYDNSHSLGY